MIGRLAALILLSTTSLSQTAEVPHLITSTELEVGGDVTFHCPVSRQDISFFQWCKQPLGKMVQTVARELYGSINLVKPFNDSRFQVNKTTDQSFLTIRHVNKDDEGTYFCQAGNKFQQTFINASFLAVKDHNQHLSVYVKQTPETASVQHGDSVTLQCSLLSKTNESGVQCPGEHRVHWVRTGSGGFHPSVIYTHSNTTDEGVGRSCVYRLSKTIQNFSDAGSYYCALVTCGQILFGEGTTVESRPPSDPVVFVLGGLLVFCVTVIISLICCLNRRRPCGHCKGETNDSHHPGHDRSTADNDLDGEANSMNYAALDFSTTRMKGENTNTKRKEYTECMYSGVRADH